MMAGSGRHIAATSSTGGVATPAPQRTLGRRRQVGWLQKPRGIGAGASRELIAPKTPITITLRNRIEAMGGNSSTPVVAAATVKRASAHDDWRFYDV